MCFQAYGRTHTHEQQDTHTHEQHDKMGMRRRGPRATQVISAATSEICSGAQFFQGAPKNRAPLVQGQGQNSARTSHTILQRQNKNSFTNFFGAGGGPAACHTQSTRVIRTVSHSETHFPPRFVWVEQSGYLGLGTWFFFFLYILGYAQPEVRTVSPGENQFFSRFAPAKSTFFPVCTQAQHGKKVWLSRLNPKLKKIIFGGFFVLDLVFLFER